MSKEYKKFQKKLKEWHGYIINGLTNGLTHTHRDGRNNDIEWVRSRLLLWEAFGRCVMDFQWGNNYKEFAEKELKQVAREGYSRSESTMHSDTTGQHNGGKDE